MAIRSSWKESARRLEAEVTALALACRDPRVPWYAKAVAACVVAYALSPIDLIPDFIPVLGYLDDLVILPLGVIVARRMIPAPVLIECRARAQAMPAQDRRLGRIAAAGVVAIWLLATAAAAWLVLRVLRRGG